VIKMKLTVEYSLPDEEDEFKLALNGGKYFLVLHKIKEKLRSMNKYGFNANIQTADEMLEHITDFFYAEIDGLDL